MQKVTTAAPGHVQRVAFKIDETTPFGRRETSQEVYAPHVGFDQDD